MLHIKQNQDVSSTVLYTWGSRHSQNSTICIITAASASCYPSTCWECFLLYHTLLLIFLAWKNARGIKENENHFGRRFQKVIAITKAAERYDYREKPVQQNPRITSTNNFACSRFCNALFDNLDHSRWRRLSRSVLSGRDRGLTVRNRLECCSRPLQDCRSAETPHLIRSELIGTNDVSSAKILLTRTCIRGVKAENARFLPRNGLLSFIMLLPVAG